MARAKSDEWYKSAFQDDYLWLYSHRSEEAAEKEVATAVKHLPFKSGQKILDLACGAGRHMLAFSDFGAELTGVDLSETLLAEARSRLKEAEIDALLVKSDMRELPFDEEFDGVTMWFTSFGYFENPSEDLRVLLEVKRVLRTGGWWWIDIPNPAHLEAHLVPRSERELKGPNGPAHVTETRKLVRDCVVKKITVDDPAGKRDYTERVRLYPPERFGHLVKRSGLTTVGILGDYDGATLTPMVPRQIWYGVKPDEE